MFRKTMILIPAALVAALPFAVSADGMDRSELELFRSATVTLSQAGETALNAHPGALAEIEFDDEDGRATWEAKVIGTDGQTTKVMIDANTGEVFASAQSSDRKDRDDD